MINIIQAVIHKVSKSEAIKKITANFTWLLFDRILLMIVTMLVGVYLVRYLGPERYGALSFAVSFVALFTALSNLGLPHVMVKELVNHQERHDALMGTSFVLKLLGSILLLVITFISGAFMNVDAETRIMISIIALGLVFRSFENINFFFQSKVLSKYEAIARTVSLLSISAIKLALIFTNSALIYFAFAYMLEGLFSAIFLIIFYQRKTKRIFRWTFDRSVAKVLLKECWPIIISSAVISIHMKIDQVMINQMLGSKQVGFYAAAAKLSEVWYFLPVIISSSVYPLMLKSREASPKVYKQRLQRLYDFMLILALGVAIPTTFLSDWVVRLLYGSEFALTGTVLSIHIWSGIFVFMGVVRGQWTVMERQQKFNPVIQGGGALVNVLLNLVLIPTYGIIGAAFSTLATVITNLLITPFFINAKYREQIGLILGSLNIFMLVSRLVAYIKKMTSVKEVNTR